MNFFLILTDIQHGFRSGYPWTTQLLITTEDLYEQLKEQFGQKGNTAR